MDYNNFQVLFSEKRTQRYLEATGSKADAIKLYRKNIEVSQAFYSLLNVFEVVLRNRINDILAEYFEDPDWIKNQHNGFMSKVKHKNDKDRNYLKNEVNKVKEKLKADNPASSDIISNLNLGFWISFFDDKHFDLLKQKPMKIFINKNRPKFSPPDRSTLSRNLKKIQEIRNRISHHEPICFKKGENIINFAEVSEAHKAIINLLTWIDPKIIDFLEGIDTVNATVNNYSLN